MATGQATLLVGQTTGFREVPFPIGCTVSRKLRDVPIHGKISHRSLYFYRTTVAGSAEAPVLGQLTLGLGGFTYSLMRLESPNYRLVRPILVSVQYGESGKLVTSDSHVHMYGVGESLDEALADYESMLLDYFEDLAQNHDAISDYLSQQLAWMLEVIERV